MPMPQPDDNNVREGAVTFSTPFSPDLMFTTIIYPGTAFFESLQLLKRIFIESYEFIYEYIYNYEYSLNPGS